MPKRIDLTGRKFGLWTVVRYAGNRQWLCRCSCGLEKNVSGNDIRSGNSSGCVQCRSIGAPKTHGASGTRLYTIWGLMKGRCYRPNHPDYQYYGGRGVTVCDRWRNNFENFRCDMGEPPVGMSIDRINNDGNYEPGNCRWATMKQQCRNRRTTKLILLNGELMSMKEASERLGVKYDAFSYRIRAGATAEEAAKSCL